jgi:hypothetical protein
MQYFRVNQNTQNETLFYLVTVYLPNRQITAMDLALADGVLRTTQNEVLYPVPR